jgi:hypothetical protein
MNHALFALLASVIVGSAFGQAPAKVLITTWNLEWFPNGSARRDSRKTSARDTGGDRCSQKTKPRHLLLQEVRDYSDHGGVRQSCFSHTAAFLPSSVFTISYEIVLLRRVDCCKSKARTKKLRLFEIAISSCINAVNFSSTCTTKRFWSPRCASAIQIVRRLESTSRVLFKSHPSR